MNPKVIFSFLRVSVNILYYLVIVFSIVFLVASLLNIVIKNTDKTKKGRLNPYSKEVMAFGKESKDPPLNYVADSTVIYQAAKHRYTVQVEPKSGLGYYIFITELIFIGFGIAILWNFKKIFKETNLDNPFKPAVTRRLKILAALFIIADGAKIIHYFLFNAILHQSIASPQMQLVIEIGGGIITGLIIWIIAVIFQRGIALQEENALTV